MATKIDKVFLLHPSVQKKEIKEYCFNKCKKIVISMIINFAGASWSVCKEEVCPYEADRLDIGTCELTNGETVHVVIRKLRKIK